MRQYWLGIGLGILAVLAVPWVIFLFGSYMEWVASVFGH